MTYGNDPNCPCKYHQALEKDKNDDMSHCPNCDSRENHADVIYLGDQKYNCPNCK